MQAIDSEYRSRYHSLQDQEQESLDRKTKRLLSQQPKHARKDRNGALSLSQNSKSPKSKLNASSKVAKSVARHIKHKITRNVELSEDSNISDQSAYAKKKTALVDWITEFRDYNFDNPKMVATLESSFLKMAVLKPHKMKYFKLLGEDAGKF